MKKLTIQDMIEAGEKEKAGEPSWQINLFLLSRYFDIPVSTLYKMSIQETTLLIKEMNEYVETICNYEKNIEGEGILTNNEISRFDLLDL